VFIDCSKSIITIPNSVTKIGDEAFYGCSSLTGVTIGSSVSSIGDTPFIYCNNLETITVSSSNEDFCIQDGALFDKDKTTIIACPAKTTATRFNIPYSVKNIKSYAFYNCRSITDYYFYNNNAPTLGTYPFGGTSLPQNRNVHIFLNTDGFVYNYFTNYRWNNLIPVHDLDNGLSTGDVIDYNNIIYKVLSSNTLQIGEGTKPVLDKNASTFTFPSSILGSNNNKYSVTAIAPFAFVGCSSLKEITIPASVNTLYSMTFFGSYPQRINFNSSTAPNVINAAGNSSNFTNLPTGLMANIPDTSSGYGNYGIYPRTWKGMNIAAVFTENNITYKATSPTTVQVGDGTNGAVASGYQSIYIPITVQNGKYTVTSIAHNANLGPSTFYARATVTVPPTVKSVGVNGINFARVSLRGSAGSFISEYYAYGGFVPVLDYTVYTYTFTENNLNFTVTQATDNGENMKVELTQTDEAINGVLNIPNRVANSFFTVTDIADYAFDENTDITDADISASITDIGEYAFNECAGLTQVTVRNRYADIASTAFDGCTALDTIYGYAGSTAQAYADNNSITFIPLTEPVVVSTDANAKTNMYMWNTPDFVPRAYNVQNLFAANPVKARFEHLHSGYSVIDAEYPELGWHQRPVSKETPLWIMVELDDLYYLDKAVINVNSLYSISGWELWAGTDALGMNYEAGSSTENWQQLNIFTDTYETGGKGALTLNANADTAYKYIMTAYKYIMIKITESYNADIWGNLEIDSMQIYGEGA